MCVCVCVCGGGGGGGRGEIASVGMPEEEYLKNASSICTLDINSQERVI